MSQSLYDRYIKTRKIIEDFYSHLSGEVSEDVRKRIQRINKEYTKDDPFSLDSYMTYHHVLVNRVNDILNDNRLVIEELNKYIVEIKRLEQTNEKSKVTSLKNKVMSFKKDQDYLSFSHVNNLIILLHKCSVKLVPKDLAPIFTMGRISQQLLISSFNLENSCIIGEQKYEINYEAIENCCIDMSFTDELASNLLKLI